MANPTKETKGKESEGPRTETAPAVQEPRLSDSRGLAPRHRGDSMPFSGWEPFDRLFEQFFRGWPTSLFAAPRSNWHWGLDVRENEGEVMVRAEAPGFEPGDFDVQVRGDQLILRASHQTEDAGKEGSDHEWSRQEFYRSVPLPSGTDPNKVEAHYRNGVLSVKLPRSEEAKGRRITVQG